MRSYLKSKYEYAKSRREFGRQPLFQIVPAHLLDSINPDREVQNRYILRSPVHREVQATMPQSDHEANTKELVIHDQGINHTEGGWPREVHLYNEEHVVRHRRRVQHEDNYIHTVMNLTPHMHHYINQSNAIDMYQTYFDNMRPQPSVEKYSIQTTNKFQDPHGRPVSCIAWTNDKKSKLAVSYCTKKLDTDSNQLNVCYLWDVSKQDAPVYDFKPKCGCWQIACSPIDPELLVTGLEDGTVSLFDIRQGTNAISSSSIYNSHRSPITALLYAHSRMNTEFFTGSLDGQCLWWDNRNLSKPIDQLPMSIRIENNVQPNLSNSEGVSCLEFDHGLPTKFLCGTESGLVINVNRMGKAHSEILTSYWNAHTGPVRAIHRSSCTLRMFITCGDWTIRVWSEEVRSAPIIVTRPYSYQVTDVSWAPLRYSSYMATSEDGVFYYWDLLRRYRDPIATLQVSKHGLTKFTPHQQGKFVAVGDTVGSLFLLQLSDNIIYPGLRDKQLMHQTYDRETKREHILDNRLKEIRLKNRTEEEVVITDDNVNEDDLDVAVEENYFEIVKDELRQMGGSSV